MRETEIVVLVLTAAQVWDNCCQLLAMYNWKRLMAKILSRILLRPNNELFPISLCSFPTYSIFILSYFKVYQFSPYSVLIWADQFPIQSCAFVEWSIPILSYIVWRWSIFIAIMQYVVLYMKLQKRNKEESFQTPIRIKPIHVELLWTFIVQVWSHVRTCKSSFHYSK